MRVALISTDGKVEFTQVPRGKNALDELQRLVGNGSIEAVPHARGWEEPWLMYVNEEGRINGMPPNPLAQRVAIELGFSVNHPGYELMGPAVLMGQKEGDEASLSSDQVRQIEALESAQQ